MSHLLALDQGTCDPIPAVGFLHLLNLDLQGRGDTLRLDRIDAGLLPKVAGAVDDEGYALAPQLEGAPS